MFENGRREEGEDEVVYRLERDDLGDDEDGIPALDPTHIVG